MNFDFSDDQKFLQQTARDYLAEHSPLSVCREVLETDKPYADDLWKGAAEMGWQGAVIPEEYGGAGFGHLELAMIAEEIGRALAPIPFSSSVYFATEAILQAGSDAQKKKYLPALAEGTTIGTFAPARTISRMSRPRSATVNSAEPSSPSPTGTWPILRWLPPRATVASPSTSWISKARASNANP